MCKTKNRMKEIASKKLEKYFVSNDTILFISKSNKRKTSMQK